MYEAKSEAQNTFRMRAASYDEEAQWNQEQSMIMQMLEVASPIRGPILDLCAGTGIVARTAERRGLSSVLIDSTAEMLQQYRGRGACVVADGEYLPFRDASFDLAVCRQGMHYLDLERAFGELRRVAARVALAHIYCPSAEDLPFWSGYFRLASPGRRHILLRDTLTAAANRAGLHVIWRGRAATRGTALDAVRHLDRAVQSRVTSLFLSMTEAQRQRYDLRAVNGLLHYTQHWDLVLLASGHPATFR